MVATTYLGAGPSSIQVALIPSRPHVQEILIEALAPHAPRDATANYRLTGPALQSGALQHAQGSLFIGHVTPRRSGRYLLTLSIRSTGFYESTQRTVTILPGRARQKTSPWVTRGAILAFFGALWWLSGRRRRRS